MMLWLALCLPRLPLDVFALAQPQPEPWAVIEAVGNVDRVLACNPPAEAVGVAAGMKGWAAEALAGDRKTTRLNSIPCPIWYAVFGLKKKKKSKVL